MTSRRPTSSCASGMITSTRNAKVALVRILLGRARERREQQVFVVEGVRLVEEALAAGWTFRFVLYGGYLSKRGQSLIEKLKAKKVDVEQLDEKILASLSEQNPRRASWQCSSIRCCLRRRCLPSCWSSTRSATRATWVHCCGRLRRQVRSLSYSCRGRRMLLPLRLYVPVWGRTSVCQSYPRVWTISGNN